jgi:polyferredoxin
VLLVFITVFFLSRNRATLAADPLISIFNLRFSVSNLRLTSLNWQGSMWLIVIIAVAGAILYPRFWCRYVCPAGAFLSLFNNIVILKKLLPAKWFGRCEFGLTAKDQMDCIYCNRCRYAGKIVAKEEALPPITPVPANFLWRFLVPSVLIAAIFVSATSIDKLLEVAPVGTDYSVTASASAGQPRNVDLQRVRTMIEQKQLSDREAEFYIKVE